MCFGRGQSISAATFEKVHQTWLATWPCSVFGPKIHVGNIGAKPTRLHEVHEQQIKSTLCTARVPCMFELTEIAQNPISYLCCGINS